MLTFSTLAFPAFNIAARQADIFELRIAQVQQDQPCLTPLVERSQAAHDSA
ncbi:MAG: hypothetical protein E6559_08205 [Pantoea sp.]|nr:hypothetical protein [Pantoea septica]MDU6439888.1 hypothetical protein [Pantoea sp.]